MRLARGCGSSIAMKGKTEVAAIDGVKVREALAEKGGGPFTD